MLTVSLPVRPVLLYADLTRLAQVFWNLLNNSARYTEPGGRIEVSANVEGNEVVVTVRDNGIGIPPDAMQGLFDLFFQVGSPDSSQGGLGIGLSLVKRLVEMHGGEVKCQSEGAGKGSEFVVRLPVYQEQPPFEQLPAAPAADRSVKRRILVVDDNRDGAASLSMILGLHGHDTRTAHDGLEAVSLAEAFRPDVVLLDLGLPTINGYDTCRRIRLNDWARSSLIIAVTGWGQEDDRRRCREAGFDHFMVKPIGLEALEQVLAELQLKAGQKTEIAGQLESHA